MTLDEKLEYFSERYGRDVFEAIYDGMGSSYCPWYGNADDICNMIEEDNRIEEYISELSDEISAESTSDKEYWRTMAGCLSSLIIDGNPFEEEDEYVDDEEE